MVQFPCECGQQLRARDEDAGKSVKCPSCGRVGEVPSSEGVTRPEDRTEARSERGRSDEVTADRPERDRDADYDEDRPRRRRREEPAGTSGKATTALILGLLSFLCVGSCLTGIPAVILGILALNDIGKSRGRLGGKGMAITGLVFGAIGILSLPIMIGLLLPAVQKVRGAAERRRTRTTSSRWPSRCTTSTTRTPASRRRRRFARRPASRC